ncbi:dTDP-glucose 4,6-dehydratase [Rubrivirga marina]|uniref:dTDP-glucose 4,6-dehydratase n=1 Tax=Rubrivirga marina TaxID=1196024 RepID=A0A271J118_9BACT|nr:dTDP-glucose 4,6-dehydratase [Rubrivirga marina]PAP77153.1 dTDP-glucose 4,6-dehydratase [Rubrivirga marina]
MPSPTGILVTGAAGFIGSAFVRSALERRPGAPVVSLDALTYAGSLENLRDLPEPDRHTFVEGDVRDGALVRRLIQEHGVRLVVHLAAESHVDRSITGPSAFVETNVLGTQALLDACREAEGVRFHHVSTDEVYGDLGPDDPAFTERTPYAPSSPYSASKAGSDHLVRAYARTYGLPVTITNCSNNYGPRQYPEKLIPVVIQRAVAGEPIPVYGDGGNVRDWLYVGDHCDAIWAVIDRGALGETYNVGGNAEVDNLTLVNTLCAILDDRRPDGAPHADLIEFVADRPGHDRRYAVDTTKIGGIGWSPRQSLRSGLEATVDWYLGHQDWIDAVLHRNHAPT